MIFVGFGFLMVFLKCHSWTSVGFNFIIAAWSLQVAILFTGFWHNAISGEENHEWKKIKLDITSMVVGDFGAGCVLITFGVILGKCSLMQLWCLATIELFFYCMNEAILFNIFKIFDIGGSMVIHTFGAVFGIAASFFF